MRINLFFFFFFPQYETNNGEHITNSSILAASQTKSYQQNNYRFVDTTAYAQISNSNNLNGKNIVHHQSGIVRNIGNHGNPIHVATSNHQVHMGNMNVNNNRLCQKHQMMSANYYEPFNIHNANSPLKYVFIIIQISLKLRFDTK